LSADRPLPYEIRYWEAGAKAHVIAASGELDLHAAPSMAQTLASLAEMGRTHLVIDMSDATFIDSAMIGVLAHHLRQTSGETRSLAIVCSNENIRRTFQIAGMERELTLLRTLSPSVIETLATMPRPHLKSKLLCAPRPMLLRLAPHASELRIARGFALAAARRAGLDPRQQYDLVLAANEAVANAIEHGAPCHDGSIQMWVNERPEILTVGVRNGGEFVLEPLPPDPLPERGRGLRLMSRTVDAISVQRENAEIEVQLSVNR
jgi:anti-sigma B factor antagonist